MMILDLIPNLFLQKSQTTLMILDLTLSLQKTQRLHKYPPACRTS